MSTNDIILLVLVVIAGISLPIVLWKRREGHRKFLESFADHEVCEHLRPALELLRSRGHYVRRAGQRGEDAPLELHIAPPFDPTALAEELKLAEPVRLSERNVLLCVEDECELRPVPK